MPMTQGDYALRFTGNYSDLIYGIGYHEQPITFHEFLSKAESAFMYMTTYMQVPGYVQDSAELQKIEEMARQYVVDYIMTEFDANLLGMQDYVRWAHKFEHKCADLAQSFWSQVNMINLMMAKDLEMDDNNSTTTNNGQGLRFGGQTVQTDQDGTSTTNGKVTTKQDSTASQDTDSVMREATATTVSAEDQLQEDLQYNWQHAADNAHEVRNRAGDTNQHMESETDSTSTTASENHSTAVTSFNNMRDENTTTGTTTMEYTNKMFMQERQWAVDTARQLLPLEWLRQQLRPMFYMLY